MFFFFDVILIPILSNQKQTRSNSEYFPAYCRINLTMQSIKYKGPVQWNKIPSSIREVKSLTTFKLLLQDFFKKND